MLMPMLLCWVMKEKQELESLSTKLFLFSSAYLLQISKAKSTKNSLQYKHYPKIRRGPKFKGCTFANFGDSSGTESKREKNEGKKKENKINAAATGNRTRGLNVCFDKLGPLEDTVQTQI